MALWPGQVSSVRAVDVYDMVEVQACD